MLKHLISFTVFQSLACENSEFIWNFKTENWNLLQQKFPGHIMGRIVPSVIGKIYEKEKINEIEMFMEDKETSEYSRRLDETIETTKLSINTWEKNKENLFEWLIKGQEG